MPASAPGLLEASPGPLDGFGRVDRKGRGKARRPEGRGLAFASALERDVALELWRLAEGAPGALVVRQPILDLWRLWQPGLGRPPRWCPDFLLARPRAVRALEVEDLEDDVRGRSGGAWREAWLDAWALEVHEAKGPRALESRDYVLRLAAFRAAWPRVPVYVWRRARGGGLRREDLPVPPAERGDPGAGGGAR